MNMSKFFSTMNLAKKLKKTLQIHNLRINKTSSDFKLKFFDIIRSYEFQKSH